MDPKNLGTFEQETLLRWFLNYMPMEQRFMLKKEYPAIYNQLAEAEIVRVIHLSDGRAV